MKKNLNSKLILLMFHASEKNINFNINNYFLIIIF